MEKNVNELEGFSSYPRTTGATFRVVKGKTSRTFAGGWLEVSGFLNPWLISIDVATASRGLIDEFEVLS